MFKNGWSILGLSVVGIALIWYGNTIDFWWVAFIVDIGLALLYKHTSLALLNTCLVGGLGWGLPLLWMSRTEHLHDASTVIASVMGLGAQGWFAVYAITILLGLLLGLSGGWLTRSIMAWFTPNQARQVSESESLSS